MADVDIKTDIDPIRTVNYDSNSITTGCNIGYYPIDTTSTGGNWSTTKIPYISDTNSNYIPQQVTVYKQHSINKKVSIDKNIIFEIAVPGFTINDIKVKYGSDKILVYLHKNKEIDADDIIGCDEDLYTFINHEIDEGDWETELTGLEYHHTSQSKVLLSNGILTIIVPAKTKEEILNQLKIENKEKTQVIPLG